MQFTGTLLNLFRNFYTQTGNFGFLLSCSVDNTSGNYNFGVSGSQYNLQFNMNSGGIYYGNTFIHSYKANTPFVMEVQINTGNFNVIKDSAAMMYGTVKPTGVFNYFYFQRANSNLNATFDLYVSGDGAPNYQISNVGYILTTGQTAVSGNYTNLSQFPINVFQSTAFNPQNLTFVPLVGNVNSNSSNQFVFSGVYNDFSTTSPVLINFNTNYDNPNVTFTFLDYTTQQLAVLFQNISNYTMSSNQLTRTLYYNNYSGGGQTNIFPANLFFQLTYITGSGNFAQNSFATSASYTGILVGNLYKSGFLTGTINIATGNSSITGNYVINASQFEWATGKVTGTYSGISTGLGTGIGFTGRAVGIFSGVFTGIILNGSGTLLINNALTGIASNAVSLDYPNYTNATGYINIQKLQLNDIIYIGTLNTPLIKGFQFLNETGLITYLSGNSQFLTNGYYSGNNIYLTARNQGSVGNGILISGQTCDIGTLVGSNFLTGGTNNGSTGLVVVPIGIYTGGVNFSLTGSGNYSIATSGNQAGTFFYTRTFTGNWSIFTGLTANSLVQIPETNGNTISGSGLFSPNSSVVFQVTNNKDIFNLDGALLTISGQNVINPIQQALYN